MFLATRHSGRLLLFLNHLVPLLTNGSVKILTEQHKQATSAGKSFGISLVRGGCSMPPQHGCPRFSATPSGTNLAKDDVLDVLCCTALKVQSVSQTRGGFASRADVTNVSVAMEPFCTNDNSRLRCACPMLKSFLVSLMKNSKPCILPCS